MSVLSRRVLRVPILVAIYVFLTSGLAASAQNVSLNFKLISPGVGWVSAGNHLFWTNNDGVTWTDITPPGPGNQSLLSVFFLDPTHGWAAFAVGSSEADSSTQIRLVQTHDEGKNWNSLPFDRTRYSSLKNRAAIPSALWFVDAQHGWFQWTLATSSAFSSGLMYSTSDGGATWVELADPPSAGNFRFQTTQDGWMVSPASDFVADGDTLNVTHDGGKTWQEVTIPKPNGCAKCQRLFSDTKFEDVNHGVVAVTYVDPIAPGGREINATYATGDSGKSWQSSEVYEQSSSEFSKSGMASVVGGHAIRVFNGKSNEGIQLRNGNSAINSSYPKSLPPRGFISASDFVDDLQGWLAYNTYSCAKFKNPRADGKGSSCLRPSQQFDLIATNDGGKTFNVITPPTPVSTAPQAIYDRPLRPNR